MRFNANGPNIPDALLEARDLGDVLFFCGAGVSRHKARLPDFARLACQVASDLGAARQGSARRLLDASKPKKRGGWPLPIAVDRVFSLLQQEFEVDDVRRAVAQALRVPEDVDLSRPIMDALLRQRMCEIAKVRVRYGARRIHVLLCREGWAVNH